MFKNIIRILKILRLEVQQFKSRNIENPTTGISFSERQKIKAHPRMEHGISTIFKLPFHFSDKEGFLHSLDEIFGQDTYKFISNKDNPVIIDCGANIGLSVLYFNRLFPNATIIAFEPDEQIFQLLKKNITQINTNKNIQILKEAVWICDTELSFFSEGSLAGSSVTDFGKTNNVITVKAVDLKKYLTKKIDFLKIDIEGAENDVIFDIAPLLHNVENLFLEYHGLRDNPQNLGDILNLIKEQGFQYYIRVAADNMRLPFCEEMTYAFNQQLNIFCYRKK